jgi:hypothetical protein
MVNELQAKLIRLALDPAAEPGEIRNAAIKLVESWRREGMSFESIFGKNGNSIYNNDEIWAPDYGLCVLNFGKHKGKEFKDIPPSYFRWLLLKLKEDLVKDPDGKWADSNRRLIDDIEAFLKQY